MKLVLVLAALAAATPSYAAQKGPELTAKIYNGGPTEAAAGALRTERLAVNTVLVGGLAQTTLEVTFGNPTAQTLEGDFALSLPTGAVVNGYALDVAGKMVDGVLTSERRAKLTYENRLRRGADPGLAEVTRDNRFHTRVFPILPGRSRTIRLSYAAPLAADGSYSLPLTSNGPLGDVNVTVAAPGALELSQVTTPRGLKLKWRNEPEGRVARGSARDVILNGDLVVRLPAAESLELSRHASGERFFELRLPFAAEAAARPRRLRIYWDSSRSRHDDRLQDEAEALARYVDRVRPEQVELVTFNDRGAERRTLASASGLAVRSALLAVRYEGATSLAGVFGGADADTCIVVSDGRITLGSWNATPPPCRTFTMTSAADADRDLLGALAERGGGKFVELGVGQLQAAVDALSSVGPPAFTLTTDDGQEVDHRLLSAPSGEYRIIGKAPSASALVFTSGAVRRTFSLAGRPARQLDAAGAIWGRAAIADLMATDRPDQEDALALARRYSVAAGGASFVVLENAQDYVDAGVAPPASAGDLLLRGYQQQLRSQKEVEGREQAQRLAEVLAAWTEQQAWWERKYVVRRVAPKVTGGLQPRPPVSVPDAPQIPPLPVPPVQQRIEEPHPPGAPGGEPPQEVVVTGSLRPAARPQIDVVAADWNPDRPYLRALAAARPEDYWRVYGELEAREGEAPAFYFDVAEALFRAGRVQDAIRVVVNALEAPSADTTTLIIVADRLQRYGDIDRAIWLLERLLFLEPDRPQPRRSLALALIARSEHRASKAREADQFRALRLLNEIIMRPWPHAYEGIEMVALMDANHLITRMKAAGLEQDVLDPRLVRLLDVDIRAVLEWNTDATDMDLWVDEPTGERAIYNNPKTAIGGRLSNDMTDGFGPEEYLLHRAPNGDYVVQVNVYRSDQLAPNGPTTVRVRLYRDWGRPTEKEETLSVELKRGQDGTVKVGRFTVTPVR